MKISIDNKIYFYWRYIPAIFSIFSAINCLYSSAFRNHLEKFNWETLGFLSIIEVIFLLDIILPFFSEYVREDGKVEKDFYEIAARNIKSGSFIYDTIAIIPWRRII